MCLCVFWEGKYGKVLLVVGVLVMLVRVDSYVEDGFEEDKIGSRRIVRRLL